MRTLYQCEVCGTVYKLESLAQRCEAYAMPNLFIQVGDTVMVQTRYDGCAVDTVKAVSIGATFQATLMADWDSIPEALANDDDFSRFHEYVFAVGTVYEISKDHFTDQIPQGLIHRVKESEGAL